MSGNSSDEVLEMLSGLEFIWRCVKLAIDGAYEVLSCLYYSVCVGAVLGGSGAGT